MGKINKAQKNPVILVVMDGWGIGDAWGGNAITVADTPNFDSFWKKYPHTQLKASGEAVGVSPGEAGSSEVGHMNMGAGYIVKQQLPLINEAIESGKFLKNPVLGEIAQWTRDKKSVLHIIGLVSDGGVHSHLDHLLKLIEFCKIEKVTDVRIHVFTDGRDADIHSGQKYLDQLQYVIRDSKSIHIASVTGRYYPMDRDKHWDRTREAYDMLVGGKGLSASNYEQAILNSYAKGVTDEFILPTKIEGEFKPIKDKDAIICINYRADRVRQILSALTKVEFGYFPIKKFQDLLVAGFVQYARNIPTRSIFPVVNVKEPVAKVIARAKLSQFHIAETEKYPHVTYFFNGGNEEPFLGEDRAVIPSPKVATYDMLPQMSAEKITKELIYRYKKKKYHFIIVNFANSDMVGHTGNLPATIKAVETIDEQLGKLKQFFVDKYHGQMIITADHGNAEIEVNSLTGGEDTEHSTNPVPCILISKNPKLTKLKKDLALSSIAPTIIKLMGLKKPQAMTSPALFD